MTKRIPCRVVRSVPLSESWDSLRGASRSNTKRHKIDDVVAENAGPPYCVWESSVKVQARHASISVTYSSRLDMSRETIDDGLSGQTLDSYV